MRKDEWSNIWRGELYWADRFKEPIKRISNYVRTNFDDGGNTHVFGLNLKIQFWMYGSTNSIAQVRQKP